ncbi:MAG: UPF0175 family protein, partial [Fimbriimonadales bacterium]|nr:UPF0175 family protein [Fimbriimonadales bacterium]
MKTIEIPLPESLVESLAQDEAQLQQELRWLIAAKLYEMGRVSAGVAAELVGVSRAEFLTRLSAFGVSPINLDAEAL